MNIFNIYIYTYIHYIYIYIYMCIHDYTSKTLQIWIRRGGAVDDEALLEIRRCLGQARAPGRWGEVRTGPQEGAADVYT